MSRCITATRSTVRPPLRLLNYCLQVWLRWRKSHADQPGLPLIVPLGATVRASADRPDPAAPGVGARSPGREARADLLEWATRLMGELYRAAGFDELAKDVEYVPATQPNEYRPLRGQIRTIERFLGRNIPWAALDTQVAMTVFRKLRQTLLCLQLLPPRQVLHPR